jgi:hypothetical protein
MSSSSIISACSPATHLLSRTTGNCAQPFRLRLFFDGSSSSDSCSVTFPPSCSTLLPLSLPALVIAADWSISSGAFISSSSDSPDGGTAHQYQSRTCAVTEASRDHFKVRAEKFFEQNWIFSFHFAWRIYSPFWRN